MLLKSFLILSLVLSISCTSFRQPSTALHKQPKEAPTALQERKEEAIRLSGELAALKVAINEQEAQQTASQALWLGRISGLLAIIALVSSFFLNYPVLSKVLKYGSLILGGISFLSFIAVHLVPYLTIIGSVLLFLILSYTAYSWFLDRKSLKDVVSAVNETKNEIPDYKNKLKKHISATSDKHIDHIRSTCF